MGRGQKDPFGNWVKSTNEIVSMLHGAGTDRDFVSNNMHTGLDAIIEEIYENAPAATPATDPGRLQEDQSAAGGPGPAPG
jgi:hypothetical protein